MTERTAYDIPWLPNEMADLLDALAQSADRATLSYSETAHIARNAAKTIRWLMTESALWQDRYNHRSEGDGIEIERLRALLHEGSDVTMQYGDDGSVAYWRAKVRAALENKP